MSAWSGRLITTPGGLHPSINLGKDAHRTKVFDVNGDGLVDIVRTTGTELQIWFALGRYPGGDGLFGHAWWTGAKTAQISLDPVTRPLLLAPQQNGGYLMAMAGLSSDTR